MGKAAKLSALKVLKLSAPGRYGDGGGLWLQISRSIAAGQVTKSWLFRYMRNGRARQMGLGSVDVVTLSVARDKALTARRLLADGIDPIDARQQQRRREKEEAVRSVPFKDCAQRYIDAHQASWRNEKHRAQWKATLETYAYPVIGNIAVSAVDTALVLKVIEPLWQSKTETASRVRGRIERILDWAKVREYRTGENPARWKSSTTRFGKPCSITVGTFGRPAMRDGAVTAIPRNLPVAIRSPAVTLARKSK